MLFDAYFLINTAMIFVIFRYGFISFKVLLFIVINNKALN